MRKTYIVTLCGSPPNAEMCLCTQRRAARSVTNTLVQLMSLMRTRRRLTILETQIPNTRITHLLPAQEAENTESSGGVSTRMQYNRHVDGLTGS